MLNSNYKTVDDTVVKIKKKFIKDKLEEAPSVEDLNQEISLNKKATVSNDYQNKKDSAITGGNYNEIDPVKTIDPKVLDGGEVKNADSKWGTGSGGAKAGSAAMGALGMVGTVMAQKGPMNAKERGANIMSLTSQGAQAGAAFGPTGMAIGAAAGLLTGGIMAIGDQKELDNKAKIERVAMLDDIKDKRMKSQKLEEGKKAVAKNKSLLEAQMGMLGSNYSPSKTV